jgi:DNA polymerase III epsilon subunit-like protein
VLTRSDVYISADVETDGPIPGPYSLLSVGLCVAGMFNGREFRRTDPWSTTFYAELQPISSQWQPEALAVNGLDREALVMNGRQPSEAMEDAARWVEEVAGPHRAVLVAYPVAFDWAFLYWYFVRFSNRGSPFGFSSCLDIRTLYQASAHTVHDLSGKEHMPGHLLPSRPHTHNALEDAIEQAELFSNVFAWTLSHQPVAT